MLPALLLAHLAVPSAEAAETVPILVSALQPETPEDQALATLLEGYLATEIANDDELDVIRIEDTKSFEDYSARIYIESCPPGDILGCTSIVAERGNADFAVSGMVRTTATGTEVEVDILDMKQSRVVVSFKSELAPSETGKDGDTRVFAQGVARILAAAVHGEVGQEQDIRTEGDDDDEPAPKLDNDAVAREIAQLSKDLGEVTVALTRPNKAIPKTSYTLDDLAGEADTDAAKPWERLDMSPGEYLRYKNSGYNLVEWRKRAAGRQGQLLIAPMIGYANGAMGGMFYGSYATDDTTQVVDSWSAETQQSGSGAWLNAVVSFGILPTLDVGVSVGAQTGTFTREIDDQVVGQFNIETSEPSDFSASRVTLGARASVALLPARTIRPRFGAGIDWMQGYSITQFEALPEWVTVFPAQNLLIAQGYAGGEARISKNVDFVLQVPITVMLTGTAAQTSRTSTQSVVTATTPDGPSVLGAGITAGIQIRLFGAKGDAMVIEDGD